MAARNNPLINWLNLSFDSFNLLHRWFGRIVVLEAVVHTVSEIAAIINTGGVAAFRNQISHDPMIMYGFIVRASLTFNMWLCLLFKGCYNLCRHYHSSKFGDPTCVLRDLQVSPYRFDYFGHHYSVVSSQFGEATSDHVAIWSHRHLVHRENFTSPEGHVPEHW